MCCSSMLHFRRHRPRKEQDSIMEFPCDEVTDSFFEEKPFYRKCGSYCALDDFVPTKLDDSSNSDKVRTPEWDPKYVTYTILDLSPLWCELLLCHESPPPFSTRLPSNELTAFANDPPQSELGRFVAKKP